MNADLLEFTRSRPELVKTAAAGLVGAALPLVTFGAARLFEGSGFICPSGGLECIIPIGLSSIAVTLVVAWVALALIRVRAAWLVVLGGSVLSLLVGWATTLFVFAPGFWLFALLTATSFAVAAMVTMRLIGRTRWGVAAVALVAAYPVAAVLTPGQNELDRRNSLEALGVPLLVADLPGYRLATVSLYAGPGLTYFLVPDGVDLPAPYAGRRPGDIEVQVTSVPARFKPPVDCVNFSAPEPPPIRCEPVGPQMWRRPMGIGVGYIAREDDFLVTVGLDPGDSAESLFRQVVVSGKARSAAELAEYIP
jgi:hypothetical protein